MRLPISRAVVLLAVAAATVPAALPGQTARFVVRRGTDTLATEVFARAPGAFQGELVVRGGPTVTYTVAHGPDLAATRAEVRVAPPGGGAVQRYLAAFTPDTVYVQVPRGDTVRADVYRFPGRSGTVPFVNLSSAVLEHIVRRARAVGGERVDVPLLVLSSRQQLVATVERPAEDEVVLTAGGVAVHLAVDEEGWILGGVVPTQGVVFERTDPAGRLPAGAAAALAPDYSAPTGAPYTAEEVTLRAPAGHTLAGTLTLPRGARRPVPAVVLVTGSGPQDRDAATPAVPGYRFFRQIADTLGRRGIAVLRLDDRGVGRSGGVADTLTTAHLADDVRAALAYLKRRREVDGRRLAVVGHSEGALIAPMVAVAEPAVRAVVLMGGQSWTGRRINAHQNRSLLERSGATPAQVDSFMAVLPATQDSLGRAVPWFGFFLDYDPLPAVRRVSAPVLILHGATDGQVPPEQAREVEEALRAAGNPDVLAVVFPDLNHLFLHDPDGTADVARYAALPSKAVPPRVLGAIADWLVGRLVR